MAPRERKRKTNDTDNSKLKQMKLFDPKKQNVSQQKKKLKKILFDLLLVV